MTVLKISKILLFYQMTLAAIDVKLGKHFNYSRLYGHDIYRLINLGLFDTVLWSMLVFISFHFYPNNLFKTSWWFNSSLICKFNRNRIRKLKPL